MRHCVHTSCAESLSYVEDEWCRVTVPAVIEGGPGRGQGQALAQLVPLPSHVPQLEQHRLHLLAHLVAVQVGGRR